MTKRFTRSTEVQSLLFDKGKWTITKAKQWLSSHGHKTPKSESSGDYHRFRQRPPFQFKAGTFRTITFGRAANGIKAVIAVPRTASKKNPSKSAVKKSLVPALMVDLADARAVVLEDNTELKFLLKDKFALCSSRKGDELWIVSRKGGKKVATQDQQAENLFERFTGFEAEDVGDLITMPDLRLKRIGRAKAIVYRSDKFSTKDNDYVHPFKVYPTVSVDNKTRPRMVALRGGRIRVTAEGIKG
jgi:hypothetical protein